MENDLGYVDQPFDCSYNGTNYITRAVGGGSTDLLIEYGIAIDHLEDAVEYLSLAASIVANRAELPKADKLICSALHKSAIIAFCNVVHPKGAIIFAYDRVDGGRERIEVIRHLRRTFAAHNSSQLHIGTTFAAFEELPDGSLEHRASGVRTVRVLHLTTDDFSELSGFFKLALDEAKNLIQPLKDELEARARAWPKEEIMTAPLPTLRHWAQNGTAPKRQTRVGPECPRRG